MFDLFVHNSHDFTIVIHLCIIACSLLLGSILRSKIRLLQKYLIPAPMIAGLFLFLFYNFIAGPYLTMTGHNFLEELMFHLLNISFIAMQLRIPEPKTKQVRKQTLWQNVTALLAEYGLQCTLGLLVAGLLFGKMYPGAARALGLCLCLGFELGPGQAGSIARVWEGEPYNVVSASDVGLSMAAIGFVVGSIVGVILINRAAAKGWISADYVEKLRNRKMGNGFYRNRSEQLVGSYQTTAQESMDSFTLHISLVLLTYLLSIAAMAGLEKLVAVTVGGKVLEAVQGLWGINFVFSSLFAILVRKVIIKAGCSHVIDNNTCNRIDGVSVDVTIAACLGAIELSAIRTYWPLILTLSLVGILITCFITPWFCSRLFGDYSFFRFLMIFGTANGTLPTALSLVRVVDPDFETPVAQDYVNATGVMFVFALPILALVNWPAKGRIWLFTAITAVYVVVAGIMYVIFAGKKAFAKGGFLFKDDNSV